MIPRWRNWSYAAFGSCGALGGLTLTNTCSGACSACFGCVVAGGSLAVLAIARNCRKPSKEIKDGLAETGY